MTFRLSYFWVALLSLCLFVQAYAASANFNLSASAGAASSRNKANGSVSQINRPEADERNRSKCALLQKQKQQLQSGGPQRYGNYPNGADQLANIENAQWSLGCKFLQ